MLREGQRRHPADFWLAFELALACERRQPPLNDDAARFYTAALALRPDSVIVRNNLGNALRELKRPSEAETLLREALAVVGDGGADDRRRLDQRNP